MYFLRSPWWDLFLPSPQVIVTADLTKSPPVIKVYSVNPYAAEKPTEK